MRIISGTHECCFDMTRIIEAIGRASGKSSFYDDGLLELIVQAASGDDNAKEELEQIRAEERVRNEKRHQIFDSQLFRNKKDINYEQSIIGKRVKQLALAMTQHTQRQPQGDWKTISIAASMPIPPMNNKEGGQILAFRIGA